LRAALARRGISEERLAKLKAPAGLDLGAITPEEIAISILAEIVAVQRSKDSRAKPKNT
jgi:xanthine dehydrogenase accessory factor